MDESHGVGEGRYRQLFPNSNKDPTDVFVEHLQRVSDICVRHGLQPLIWSDMLFTLANKNNSLSGYYDNNGLPQELQTQLPSKVQLVYWDYYHTRPDVYQRKIHHHRELGCEPWVAGGIWTWNRLYTALGFSFEASRACLKACKRDNVRNVFVTTWGDDGNEVDILSAFPGLAFYGEHAYTPDEEIDICQLKRTFAAVVGGNLDDWVYASKLDQPMASSQAAMAASARTQFPPNASKWLLWQDPFYAMFSP
ncbi:hypothetical protein CAUPRSCDRAFT_12862, partial [Caulochytrium protostelioides]